MNVLNAIERYTSEMIKMVNFMFMFVLPWLKKNFFLTEAAWAAAVHNTLTKVTDWSL